MQISTKCATIQTLESPTPTCQASSLSPPPKHLLASKLCLVNEVSNALTITEASFGSDQSVPIKHKREHSGGHVAALVLVKMIPLRRSDKDLLKSILTDL